LQVPKELKLLIYFPEFFRTTDNFLILRALKLEENKARFIASCLSDLPINLQTQNFFNFFVNTLKDWSFDKVIDFKNILNCLTEDNLLNESSLNLLFFLCNAEDYHEKAFDTFLKEIGLELGADVVSKILHEMYETMQTPICGYILATMATREIWGHEINIQSAQKIGDETLIDAANMEIDAILYDFAEYCTEVIKLKLFENNDLGIKFLFEGENVDNLSDKALELLITNPYILKNPEKYINDTEVQQLVKESEYFQQFAVAKKNFSSHPIILDDALKFYEPVSKEGYKSAIFHAPKGLPRPPIDLTMSPPSA
jgi:hypothetical protein